MEGRTLRLPAGSTTEPQTGSGPDARRTRRVVTAWIAVTLVASTLTVVGPPVAGMGVAAAHAACRYAHRGPHETSRGHAQHAVVCLMNNARRHHGRHRLRAKGSLRQSGKRHSSYMRRHRCFSHQCSGEKDLVARVMATPYLPCHCTWRLGENIARGQGRRASPAAIVSAWMHSPPHRAEILSPSLRDVGVGVVWGSKRNRRANVGTFTADFGSKRHY